MASTSDLTTRARALQFARKDQDTTAGTLALMDRLVSVASDTMRTLTSRQISAKTYTAELHDGDSAVGRGRKIYTQEYPVTAIPTVITENGTALTIATGYSTTANVIAILPDGILVRQGCIWAPGIQNIAISYPAGFTFPRSSETAPAAYDLTFDIEQAVAELAALMFTEGGRIGESSRQFGSWTIQYIRTLNPALAAVIDATSRGFRPVT